MNTNAYVTVSALIFTIVAFVHLFRVVQGWTVQIGTLDIPLWLSVVAVAASSIVAAWGFSLLKKSDHA